MVPLLTEISTTPSSVPMGEATLSVPSTGLTAVTIHRRPSLAGTATDFGRIGAPNCRLPIANTIREPPPVAKVTS